MVTINMPGWVDGDKLCTAYTVVAHNTVLVIVVVASHKRPLHFLVKSFVQLCAAHRGVKDGTVGIRFGTTAARQKEEKKRVALVDSVA